MTNSIELKNATTELFPEERANLAPSKPAKKTAVKKVVTKKTTTKKVSSKPAAKVEKKAELKMVSFFTNDIADSRYGNLQKNRSAFSGYTIAALIFSKMVVLTKAGTPTKARTKPQLKTFAAIVGPSAARHWTTKGRIDIDGLTVAGLNEVQARCNGTAGGYSTDTAIVNTLLKGLSEGGIVEIPSKTGGVDKFNFQCTNAISV